MKNLKKWIYDCLTEPNNHTICPIRLLAIVGFLWALVASGWTLMALSIPFDVMAFGGAYGAMLVAMGAALGIKTDSKEKADNAAT